jgi:DNA-binding transcriptional MerR regulator
VTQPADLAAVRRASKSASAFRTIGEVAEDLELPPHVLRFWESKFPQLKPLKRGGGRRYYRPEDVDLLRQIRQCLYRDGYTIRGVQKLLREGGLRPGGASAADAEEPSPPTLFPLPAEEAAPNPAGTPSRRTKPGRAPPGPVADALRRTLEEIRDELMEARALLMGRLRDGTE